MMDHLLLRDQNHQKLNFFNSLLIYLLNTKEVNYFEWEEFFDKIGERILFFIEFIHVNHSYFNKKTEDEIILISGSYIQLRRILSSNHHCFLLDADFFEPVIKEQLDPNGLIWAHRNWTGSERIFCFFRARNKKWTRAESCFEPVMIYWIEKMMNITYRKKWR